MRGSVRAAALCVGVLMAWSGASGLAVAYPNPGRVAGDTVIHDPAMLINPSMPPRYQVFGTHNALLSSQDRITFTNSGKWLPTNPAWWSQLGYGTDPWAPDVSFHNGKYWLYYAITAGSGSRHSAIGLATSPSGLPGTWSDSDADGDGDGDPVFTSEGP